jgi:hypothetical protein
MYSGKVPSLPPNRQKEAGNINSSLLVLGRCIKAIRYVPVVGTQYYIVQYRY